MSICIDYLLFGMAYLHPLMNGVKYNLLKHLKNIKQKSAKSSHLSKLEKSPSKTVSGSILLTWFGKDWRLKSSFLVQGFRGRFMGRNWFILISDDQRKINADIYRMVSQTWEHFCYPKHKSKPHSLHKLFLFCAPPSLTTLVCFKYLNETSEVHKHWLSDPF